MLIFYSFACIHFPMTVFFFFFSILVHRQILKYQSLPHGLFPSNITDVNDYPEGHVRDNVYCALCIWSLALAYRYVWIRSWSPAKDILDYWSAWSMKRTLINFIHTSTQTMSNGAQRQEKSTWLLSEKISDNEIK